METEKGILKHYKPANNEINNAKKMVEDKKNTKPS